MGFQLALYFALLLLFLLCPILQAAESQEPACGEEVCGNITILSPFGIHSSCYTYSWSRVTCNQTQNGKKPFINVNGIDLEVLGSPYSNGILIRNPVAYINCHHTNEASVSVNLSGTPFFFSSERNNFGSVGCGNLATILSNEADSLGGCIQPRCDDDGASESGCSTYITGNLTSYTVNMTAMYPDSNRCASAFIYSTYSDSFRSAYPLPTGINIGTTHVPAMLNWKSSNCGDTGCERPRLGRINVKPYMVESCGNVTFHYPFRMKDQDNPNDWFKVNCRKTTNGQKLPFLNINGMNLQILKFNFLSGTIVVNHPIIYFNCRENYHKKGMSLNLTGTRFYYSVFNFFWSSGCGNLVTVFGNETDTLISGCLQPNCRINNETSSIAGCRIKIPWGLSSFYINMSSRVDSSDYKRKRSCRFASMISYDSYLASELEDFDISNRTHIPTQLQWGTPIYGVCYLNDSLDTSCTSDGEYCWSRLSSNHLCVCIKDIGDIGFKVMRSMLCLNTPSNYCFPESCPPHYEFNSTGFRCERRIQNKNNHSLTSIIVGCSTSVGTLFLLLATWSMYKVLKRKQKITLKQKYFKRNGGLLLQLHLSSNEGNVEKIKLFTSKEMEKATNHYNENRILGQGGQGTVYKGMLIDGSIVAIKKSKMVEGKKFDEKKVEQFINEVIILSQINHRNVVKLLGCCLEAEVPLLVYEFIPNGTLYNLIHNQNEELPLTWEMRLRIAIEIANALFYLHSAASAPIYHRDIKSSNILLDDKYRAKVSDFGTSRSVALEQTHLTTRVQGTFGYMDPEYFRSSQFTEKSDVYSFGVVLIELLTGQKPISAEQSQPVRSLVSYFLHSMQENSLFNILDPMVVKVGPKQEIIVVALLAKRCLNLNGKKRPTMKKVAMELELIKASGGNVIEDHGDEESEIDDIIHSWETNPRCSMSRTITTDSETLPLNSTF
ncbi:hypothetical protein CXB51_023995 [Gossypium anomalum]|uniref:Protein kinase domain-containing protein n=1 Tax=Gossypium anomalum TaxID=47600 RepID=A0A8J5Z6M6_9ROSI|nr:hypothetical protein CXB51_023995 [Gossypium anomalum]